MDDGILKVSNVNPQEKTRTNKESPGNSSRDLFIPTRWRSPVQPLKGSRFHSPSQKGHVYRIARQTKVCSVFF